ncbi:ATR-interacting protein-like, partial [Scleropages formosus]
PSDAVMEYPPNKRLKGEAHCTPSDSFGDDEEFTQDDLDEIDVLASQAFSCDARLANDGGGGSLSSRAAVSQGRRTHDLGAGSPGNADRFNTPGTSRQHRATEASGKEKVPWRGSDEFYEHLKAQQAELKKKLKQVEEELMVRSGEVRVLRDALRHTQQEKDEQRQALLQQEEQRAQAHSDKEKALNRKVQSLQSELHFKEAELSEMRNKVQMCERSSKVLAVPAVRNSPKRSFSAAQQQEETSSGASSPGLSPFLTKETFSAQLSKRLPAARGAACAEEGGRKVNGERTDAKEDVPQRNAYSFESHPCQGASLLNLLLQHPLDPSILGLCHLLCLSPDALPSLLLQRSSISAPSSVGSSSSSAKATSFHSSQNGFIEAQSRAVSGLSMLASDQRLHLQGSVSAPVERTCPGALHLLPLLEYHIGLFCQVLEKVDSSSKSPLRSVSLSDSLQSSPASGVEETLGGLEEFALAALRVLGLLVEHSREVVHALLCPPGLKPETERDTEVPGTESKSAELLHPLLCRLLQLADPGIASAARRRDTVLSGSLSVLNGLAERAGKELHRLKCVASSHSVVRCLAPDSSHRVLCLTVSLLALVADSDEGAALLCSHLDSCPLLKLLQYINSRPNESITDDQWCWFELEAVRFLTKLLTQKSATWTSFSHSPCQCCAEVVRTAVLLLHRHWLYAKKREQREGRAVAWSGPGAPLLREALTLLHWMWLNDSAFAERCLDVLHLYEQVVAAVRDGFRRIPNLCDMEVPVAHGFILLPCAVLRDRHYVIPVTKTW